MIFTSSYGSQASHSPTFRINSCHWAELLKIKSGLQWKPAQSYSWLLKIQVPPSQPSQHSPPHLFCTLPQCIPENDEGSGPHPHPIPVTIHGHSNSWADRNETRCAPGGKAHLHHLRQAAQTGQADPPEMGISNGGQMESKGYSGWMINQCRGKRVPAGEGRHCDGRCDASDARRCDAPGEPPTLRLLRRCDAPSKLPTLRRLRRPDAATPPTLRRLRRCQRTPDAAMPPTLRRCDAPGEPPTLRRFRRCAATRYRGAGEGPFSVFVFLRGRAAEAYDWRDMREK